MSEKENFEINFDDKYEEIIAAMQKKHENEIEDIVSDSSLIGQKHGYEDISSTSTGKYRKKDRGFKAWWKNLTKGKKAALITAVTALVLAVAVFVSPLGSILFYNYNSITKNPEELGFSGTIDKKIINIALFGVDSRDEKVFSGNTDSIMILSLNTRTKEVKIFSVLRDTFVPMEYEGNKYHGKINSAYSKGPEHAIKTLNQAFDLDISEYATVNFFGMVDIIDAVGGIPATITEDELRWKGYDHPNLNNCMDEICAEKGLDPEDYYIKKAGEQTLNGVQAVAYARVRHCLSAWGTIDDFGRTDRQRHVMQGLFNKAVSMKKTQYFDLVKALIPCTETSLSYGDIISLATNILLSSPTFDQYRLPPAEYQSEFLMPSPSGYGSVIYYDLDYAAKLVRAVIYDDVTMEEYIQENPIERNNWYSYSGASSGRKPNTSVTSQPTESLDDTSSDNTSSDNTSSDDTVSDNTSSDDTSSDDTSSDDASSDDVSSDDTSSNTSSDDASSNDTSSETPSEPVTSDTEENVENTTP